MTLKEKLDAIWRSNTIACPSHLVRWSLEEKGVKFIIHYGLASYCLYYTKGLKTRLLHRSAATNY